MSWDLSLLVSSNRKPPAVTDTQMKSYGSGAKMPKMLLIWIRKDTSTASYLEKFKRVSVARFFAGFYPIEGFWRSLRRKVTDPEPRCQKSQLIWIWRVAKCNVKVSVSRDLSLLVFIQKKAGDRRSNEKSRIRSQARCQRSSTNRDLEITSTALYLAMLQD